MKVQTTFGPPAPLEDAADLGFRLTEDEFEPSIPGAERFVVAFLSTTVRMLSMRVAASRVPKPLDINSHSYTVELKV